MADDRGTRLPLDWEPSSKDLAFCGGYEVDPGRVRDEFKDYWMSQPGARGRKSDWSATWRNWVRKAGKPRANGASRLEEKRPDLFARPSGGRTLAQIHRSFGEAWYAITQDTLRQLADDIDMAAAELEEADRGHFHSLVAAEVQTLASPLAQAIAQGRERASFPYDRLDWQRLRDRTESQLHSTDGYEGRRNMRWWRERDPEKYGAPPKPADLGLKPARELANGPTREAEVLAFCNPNADRFGNPNA